VTKRLPIVYGAFLLSLIAQDSPRHLRSDLYVDPQPITIAGYSGSAMEPFISPDGRYLFFNNSNDPGVNTNLQFAERTGRLTFRYLGELPGVNSDVLDAVPSLDTAGHFYFTTVRDYGRTLNSLYTGEFNGKGVANVRPVPGNISPNIPGSINMDAGISPDGQTLYISRAVIVPSAPAPTKSELLLARLKGGIFSIDPDSARILKNINTGDLQYAPAISADGLELYFTRAGPTSVNILVATRTSVNEPFGEPLALRQLMGFVEAPSISLDRKEMFFHKKVGDTFMIYRAERY
jgi:hypothetical protein